MAYKPWMTSNKLIESIKRKISFPVSQNTFTNTDLLEFANEEMQISQVPSVMIYHEEYFVYKVVVPMVQFVSRYAIPDRAIGMKMRDIFFQDTQGNLYEMTRISSEDKAYWQASISGDQTISRFYLEGNDVVLSPEVTSDPSGSLVFYIYLRPNQLVDDARACIVQSFCKTVMCTSVQAGDAITYTDQNNTSKTLVAGTDFVIGGTDAITATNLSAAFSNFLTSTSSGNVVSVFYPNVQSSFSSTASSLAIQTTQGVQFDQVPATYLNPDTLVTEPLYVGGVQVDFLQTKPGHRTYTYDVTVPTNGILGNVINFNAGDVPDNFLVGDYICLSNECIIPQIPPDLHNALAERTCARILASIGDANGMQASMQKIQEMNQSQGTLLDNRAEGSPQKISGRHGILRYNKRGRMWRL